VFLDGAPGSTAGRVTHYRRCNGELWDSVEMGLLL
jgi:hypothetical protein